MAGVRKKKNNLPCKQEEFMEDGLGPSEDDENNKKKRKALKDENIFTHSNIS